MTTNDWSGSVDEDADGGREDTMHLLGSAGFIHLVNGIVVDETGTRVETIEIKPLSFFEWELYVDPTVTLAEAIACVADGGKATRGELGILYDTSECHKDIEFFFYDDKNRCGATCLPATGWTITKRGPS